MNLETSPTIGAIAAALAKAQGAMGVARKDATGRVGKDGGRVYPYASLASVWDAVRAPLAANELAVIQTTEPAGPDSVCVVTTLAHASGEWFRGRLPLPVRQADAQGFGSALTYARRYALSAIVGIAPEDDDAAEAVRQGNAPAPRREERRLPAAASPAPAAEQPAAAAPPEDRPLNQQETLAIQAFAGQFAAVKDAPSLKLLRASCRAAAGAKPGVRFRTWFFEQVKQAEAAIGVSSSPVAKAPLALVPPPHAAGAANANGVAS